MVKEYVILVNKNDEEIGIEEKIKAHLDGKLHRAFSVLVFNLTIRDCWSRSEKFRGNTPSACCEDSEI